MKKFQVIADTTHHRYLNNGEIVAEFDTYEEAENFFDKHRGKWAVDDNGNYTTLDIIEA